MPRIIDNIQTKLLPILHDTLQVSHRADFCVGYFNLRGWQNIDRVIDEWTGADDNRVRLLVGMQALPHDEARQVFSLLPDDPIDMATAARLRKRMAEQFREQLTLGAPTNHDEAGLRRLSAHLKAGKVVVKLFLRHQLHAKLYLLHRKDINNPMTGFVGSSNLTFAGLRGQGELNVDVLDHDACIKLHQWFDDRWNDRWCLDISEELAQIIDTSWARPDALTPYHIYLKMAYHLSSEARSGLAQFAIPGDIGAELFDFQAAAVKIAAHHVNKREGVIIGDVVGLGKTMMATALARVFQDDDEHRVETLIICPKNLVKMWEHYVAEYRLIAKVLPISRAARELPDLRRYRLVLIDESHNLRNPEGKRYRAIQEYIARNGSRCILLSATPYNKTYLDLSAQLRLFIPPDRDLGIRPERLIHQIGETTFMGRYQSAPRTLAAFEKSEYADDWRELMRLFLVRRTRSFIKENYAETDTDGRTFLTFKDGTRSYFPRRVPRTVRFTVNEHDPADPYARLSSSAVVDAVNKLYLPRYGLGNYVAAKPRNPPTAAEAKVLEGLGRAGKRLMGFCRTNLFKRLESGGPAFVQSVERHVLRNFVFIHAIENGLSLPIGTQGTEVLDARVEDEDADTLLPPADDDGEPERIDGSLGDDTTEQEYRDNARETYEAYAAAYKGRYKWLPSSLFVPSLLNDLLADARALLRVLDMVGEWDDRRDTKLLALVDLLLRVHPREKVLIFTQFADTARYLWMELQARGIDAVEWVTGSSADPTALAWRFSPRSNNKTVAPHDELRVLIATDVLSEGQNLQDCAVIVNYDLPWAIIRLIQRAGRVDRIGQQAGEIMCYSFLPAEGVDRIINLRGRVRQRLNENAEVVGTDEVFFEDDRDDAVLHNLYNEKAGILDGEADAEVDLASQAYQIWKNATDRDPSLRKIIPELPPVVYSARGHAGTPNAPDGVLMYMRTTDGTDALAWVDREGRAVSQSQWAILQAAACDPDTPAVPRHPAHHDLVRAGVEHIAAENVGASGQLGGSTGARFRTYERLKRHALAVQGTLLDQPDLAKAIDEIYHYPLHEGAKATLNRQLRSGIDDQRLADLVLALRDDDRLCIVHDEDEHHEPQIICSLGLVSPGERN
jgi:hypothetical protein